MTMYFLKRPHEMFLTSGISAALRVVGSMLAFAGNVLVARILGPEDAGFYFLALSTVVMMSVLGRSGLDFAVLKFVSLESARNNYGMAQRYFTSAFTSSFVRSLISAIILLLCARTVASTIFSKPDLGSILEIMAGSIVFYSLWMICGEALKAIKRPIGLMIVSSVVNPGLFIIFVWWLAPKLGTEGAALAFVISTLVTCLACYALWKNAVPDPHLLLPAKSTHSLRASSRNMLIYTIVNEAVIPFFPLLLLGVYATPGSVGYFGAASRISIFMLAFLMLTHTMMAPYLAESIRTRRLTEAIVIARRSSLFLLFLTSPLFFVIFLYPSEVMLLFGPGFENGGASLIILSSGRLIQILLGPTSVVLMVMKKEKTLQNIYLISATALVAVAVLLIPTYGATAAAVSASAGITIGALGSLICVYKATGQVVYPRW